MARGWESKAVEAQQEAAAERKSGVAPGALDDVAVAQERATLMLARARALAQLQNACAASHRAMLEHAIADLDARLERLRG
jgi:GR25 family glycosyltransferase involved in LPS biosynthesis